MKIATQEQLYIKIFQGEKVAPEEIPKEFLKDFQFCKIALEKNRIDLFSEGQQREMNLQTVEIYLHSSEIVRLQYDIPEITKLVPENFLERLILYNSQIMEFPQLKSVGENLDLEKSQIRELPKLESVVGGLNLTSSQIKELPQLKSVGGNLLLRNSKIRKLPQLESVGFTILVNREDLQYWKTHFTKTNRPHLASKVFAV